MAHTFGHIGNSVEMMKVCSQQTDHLSPRANWGRMNIIFCICIYKKKRQKLRMKRKILFCTCTNYEIDKLLLHFLDNIENIDGFAIYDTRNRPWPLFHIEKHVVDHWKWSNKTKSCSVVCAYDTWSSAGPHNKICSNLVFFCFLTCHRGIKRVSWRRSSRPVKHPSPTTKEQ